MSVPASEKYLSSDEETVVRSESPLQAPVVLGDLAPSVSEQSSSNQHGEDSVAHFEPPLKPPAVIRDSAVSVSEQSDHSISKEHGDARIAVDIHATTSATANIAEPEVNTTQNKSSTKKDVGFWLVMASLCMSTFLSAMDLTSVSTALPTIVNDLNGANNFVWVGSAYSLASTAILPLAGNIANIFGRQTSLLAYLGIFAAGSAVTGSAQNMSVLITGRTIQGLGGGGILAMSQIVIADLVSLSERGLYMGILAAGWAIASAGGPIVGGGLAQVGAWRWLFYLNLPLCGIAFTLVLIFLRLKKPTGTMWSKVKRVDWSGNALAITATTITIVALVEGGVSHPWNSYQILVPLCLGGAGIAAWILFEAYCVREPTVPFDILSNRTSLSGYIGTFIHGIGLGMVVFYIPVYFQATMLASPIRSSVMMFPITFTTMPFAVLTGVSVAVLHHYMAQNVLGWIFCGIGAGLLSTLKIDSTEAEWVSYQVIQALGGGILFIAVQFPILAPLPPARHPHAITFFTFVRAFAQTFGVTIGSTVLENELAKKLPANFLSLLPSGLSMSYSAIPEIRNLPQPLQDEVRTAFASSLSTLWLVLVGLGGVGFLSSLCMKQLALHKVKDENWGRVERPSAPAPEGDVEKAATTA